MSDTLIFDSLELTKVPVKIAGVEYTLREASGGSATEYRDRMMGCTTLGPTGKPSKISGMAKLEIWILSRCLYDTNNNQVNQSTIESWPNSILKKLFAKLEEISELQSEQETVEILEKRIQMIKEREEAAKNESSGMMDGSD